MGIYTRALSVCLCYNQVSVPSCLLHMTDFRNTVRVTFTIQIGNVLQLHSLI